MFYNRTPFRVFPMDRNLTTQINCLNGYRRGNNILVIFAGVRVFWQTLHGVYFPLPNK